MTRRAAQRSGGESDSGPASARESAVEKCGPPTRIEYLLDRALWLPNHQPATPPKYRRRLDIALREMSVLRAEYTDLQWYQCGYGDYAWRSYEGMKFARGIVTRARNGKDELADVFDSHWDREYFYTPGVFYSTLKDCGLWWACI